MFNFSHAQLSMKSIGCSFSSSLWAGSTMTLSGRSASITFRSRSRSFAGSGWRAQTRDTDDGKLSAGVIHVDSLDYQTVQPCVKPLSSVHSDMGNDIAKAAGNAVLAIPGVLQPRGSRLCGVCACVNQLLLVECTLPELLVPDCIEILLEKYDLPSRASWTRENWTRAGLVLIKDFIAGNQSSETVESLLRQVSAAIRADHFLIDEIECVDAVPSQQERNQENQKRHGSLRQTRLDFGQWNGRTHAEQHVKNSNRKPPETVSQCKENVKKMCKKMFKKYKACLE